MILLVKEPILGELDKMMTCKVKEVLWQEVKMTMTLEVQEHIWKLSRIKLKNKSKSLLKILNI